MTHYYRWKKYRPELFGLRCVILARGSMNSLLVRFEGGELCVVSRNAVRKLKGDTSLGRSVEGSRSDSVGEVCILEFRRL